MKHDPVLAARPDRPSKAVRTKKKQSSTAVRAAAQVGSTKTRKKKSPPSLSDSRSNEELLLIASIPLLELFAVVDDVFTEDDAFSPDKMRSGLGRIYRAWKSSRTDIDPSFDQQRYRHEVQQRQK